MAAPWLNAFPRTAKPILDEIDEVLRIPLTKILSEGTNARSTRRELPARYHGYFHPHPQILENEFGFKLEERVDFTLGHSLGEFAALVAGGYSISRMH